MTCWLSGLVAPNRDARVFHGNVTLGQGEGDESVWPSTPVLSVLGSLGPQSWSRTTDLLPRWPPIPTSSTFSHQESSPRSWADTPAGSSLCGGNKPGKQPISSVLTSLGAQTNPQRKAKPLVIRKLLAQSRDPSPTRALKPQIQPRPWLLQRVQTRVSIASGMGPMLTSLGFAGQVVSVATTQLCHGRSTKAATGHGKQVGLAVF